MNSKAWVTLLPRKYEYAFNKWHTTSINFTVVVEITLTLAVAAFGTGRGNRWRGLATTNGIYFIWCPVWSVLLPFNSVALRQCIGVAFGDTMASAFAQGKYSGPSIIFVFWISCCCFMPVCKHVVLLLREFYGWNRLREKYCKNCAVDKRNCLHRMVFRLFARYTQMQPWFMIWNNIERAKIYGVRFVLQIKRKQNITALIFLAFLYLHYFVNCWYIHINICTYP